MKIVVIGGTGLLAIILLLGASATVRPRRSLLRGRLINIFRHDEKGRRPVFGAYEKMQTDPHFKDYILFHEYFDGDTGKASAAS